MHFLISSRALMITVKIDAKSGNLMENSLLNGKTVAQNSHPVICLYIQEYNHGTCLKFPRNVAGILMHLFNKIVFRCTKSSTIFSGLIHQGGKIKYEGVSKLSENARMEAVKNCLIRRPKVCIALGLAPNNFIYLLSNTSLCAGCFRNYSILVAAEIIEFMK